ncbi:Predicted permease [Methylacidimicrobium sp. AP8]|uniref:LptF/LptG family permease n=1 Tax=Methylacidimicrobium sp. AP8 TaxID=2730359 RepID=UPI0018C1CCDD|nr:LptF/LptG family permease [Methylacidimicrobium sp. AP8]CAB4242885.1 Predicted permease [Methylacidimicrobium sp. AP8]
MKILSRYLYASFLKPLLFSIVGFLSLLVLADLFGSLEDFITNKTPTAIVVSYYTAFLPAALIIVAPPATLFAALYCLMQFQRHSEFIAMQSCCVPLSRIFLPFLVVGVGLTVALLAIQLGPGGNSQARRDQIMEQIKGNRSAVTSVRGMIFREAGRHRIWYFQELDLGAKEARNLEVIVQNVLGADQKKYFARLGRWKDGHWTLIDVNRVDYDAAGNFRSSTLFPELALPAWDTPPQRMVALETKPRDLDARELWKLIANPGQLSPRTLAPYKIQFYNLFAEPCSAFVLLLLGLSEGARLNRRHPTAGVFHAIFILIAFFLVYRFFLILGQGSRLPAPLAVSLPLAGFLIFGLLRLAPLFGIDLPRPFRR